jgi:homoserine kinase
MSDVVTAFAPASIGNLAVGFDMLGLALAGVGDRVSARPFQRMPVRIRRPSRRRRCGTHMVVPVAPN